MSQLPKSETPEVSPYRTICEQGEGYNDATVFLVCPFCQRKNSVCLGNLDDLTVPDVEACQCYNCHKKFWINGFKGVRETNAGFFWEEIEDKATCQDLGIDEGADLIETAYCETGKAE